MIIRIKGWLRGAQLIIENIKETTYKSLLCRDGVGFQNIAKTTIEIRGKLKELIRYTIQMKQ